MHPADQEQDVIVCDLGRADYEATWQLQREIQQSLILAKRETPGRELPHVILTVEHPPVFTLGKSGDPKHLLLDREQLAARGAVFYRTDRGGDITYHGPGQQVVYPVLDLDRIYTDVHRYLRALEEAVIATCRDYALEAGRVAGRTGVWVAEDATGPERKICAMGIRCSRWVTMHGLAFNVNTDLDFFSMIVPCGISDRGVTTLARELGQTVEMSEVRERLLAHLTSELSLRARYVAVGDVNDALGPYAHQALLFTGA